MYESLYQIIVASYLYFACVLIAVSNNYAESHDLQNTNVTVVVNKWCEWCPCNTVTVKVDSDRSRPANGTPHRDNHVGLEDSLSNSKSINSDRQYSVSTTDAVSQGT